MTTRLDCGHELAQYVEGVTGYGKDSEGKRYCYACCAQRDREQMARDGRITLYLTGSTLSNWPGTLNFTVQKVRVGRHNMAGKRYDVWFKVDGEQWHGVQYGDNTQLCHCKRSK